jgi:hypothetical protein
MVAPFRSSWLRAALECIHALSPLRANKRKPQHIDAATDYQFAAAAQAMSHQLATPK